MSWLTDSKKILQSELFLGIYQERQYVEKLQTYRDVIEVDASETEFQKKLCSFTNVISKELSPDVVVGILPKWRLLVSLTRTLPFGKHWFKVKDVLLSNDGKEVQLKIKHIREVALSETRNSGGEKHETEDVMMQWGPALSHIFSTVTSPEGIFRGVKIFLFFVIAAATGLSVLVQRLFSVVHVVLKESPKVIRASTPLILGITNCLAKLVAGFVVFLGMIWKDIFYILRRKVDPEGTPPQIHFPARQSLPALPPPSPYRGTQPLPMHYPGRFPSNSHFTNPTPPKMYRRRGDVSITEL